MRAPWVLLLLALAARAEDQYFSIEVVDAETGRGVPLVELRTTSGLRYITDSNGFVAFHEPGLMNRKVFFFLKSHGYEFKKDRFGFRGKTLLTRPGGRVELKIRRVNLAERLYRITGQGIYRDSELLFQPVPVRSNGNVMGQDSVLCLPYRGQLFWIWGDTSRASYPLGNFHASGATSSPDDDPSLGIRLEYFVNQQGFSKRMCPMKAPGPVWLGGMIVVEGKLLAHYVRVKTLGVYHEQGLVQFDNEKRIFQKIKQLDLKETRHPHGHPILHDGYFWFGMPFPRWRVKADIKSVTNPETYEPVDTDVALRDVGTGKRVKPHNGSISFNRYRKRWIAIVQEVGGTSYLGEVWYAEAKALTGPWVYARKIVTHDRYSFYNVKHHPYFDKGRLLYFEGTYTDFLVKNADRTPRYNYNQIMYRLDLDQCRVPVRMQGFYAYDRPGPGLVEGDGFWGLPDGELTGPLVRRGNVLVWREFFSPQKRRNTEKK